VSQVEEKRRRGEEEKIEENRRFNFNWD